MITHIDIHNTNRVKYLYIDIQHIVYPEGVGMNMYSVSVMADDVISKTMYLFFSMFLLDKSSVYQSPFEPPRLPNTAS